MHATRVFCVAICFLLTVGCTNLGLQNAKEPSAPHLVDFETKTKEMMNKSATGWAVSGAMTQMMDVLRNFPVMATAGHDFKCGPNYLWNDGKPFTGLRVVVQGSAFTKGLLGQPNPVTVSIRSEPGKSIISSSSSPFVMTGAYAYTAMVPYITCTKMIEVEFDVPALREGEGDYEVAVSPIDNSTSPITFKHPASITEPFSGYLGRSTDERASGSKANPPDQANNEPKTQYELQLKQAEAERNRRY